MASRHNREGDPPDQRQKDQDRAERLSALHERLADEVAALRTGEDWQRWLDVARRLPSYSFNNCLLIAAQRPDATAVAGYRAWQALGRQVDRGERGLQILAPVMQRKLGAAGEQTEPADTSEPKPMALPEPRGHVAGFRVTHVWDVTQTSGESLPEPPRPQLLRGQAPPGLWDALERLAIARGYAVQRGDCGAANGWTDYASRQVRVRSDVDEAQAVKTLAHEVAHVLLHEPSGTTTGSTRACRGLVEVEAESVAYLVTGAHGLSTDDYTFAYVTGWADSVEGPAEQVVRATGMRVLAAARQVLAVTEPPAPPAPDRGLTAQVAAGQVRAAQARRHAEGTLQGLSTAPDTDRPQPGDLGVLRRAHGDATAFFVAHLGASTVEASAARAALDERAVPLAAVAAYQLGLAPASWTALTDHLRSHGYDDQQLLDSGLALRSRRGTLVDRFRDRLTFPVHDVAGDVVGFLGRALHPDERTPKYLNSPETVLYRKREVLYGLGTEGTRAALAAGAHPVLVEGAFDAIAVTCAGAGRYVGVAPSGTALTQDQVAVLHTVVPLNDRKVVVAFDGDAAGRAAAVRSYDLLRERGARPLHLPLPDGQDPASLMQTRGPEALGTALDAAQPLVDHVIDERLALWADKLQWAEGRIGSLRAAAPVIAVLPAEQAMRQVRRVANAVGVELGAVVAEVVRAASLDVATDAPLFSRPAAAADVSPLPTLRTPAADATGLPTLMRLDHSDPQKGQPRTWATGRRTTVSPPTPRRTR